MATATTSILDLNAKSLDGLTVDLKKYLGHVVLVVNVASECGLTPQYEGLETLFKQYRDQGFRIMAFPCNDFGGQEPGTPAQIQQFCATKFNVDFDLLEKVTVKGDAKHPIYAYLTGAETNGAFAGEIEWNFGKFLLNKKGEVVARFHPKVEPTAPEVTALIEKLLAE